MEKILTCPECGHELLTENAGGGVFVGCPGCPAELQVDLFPRFFVTEGMTVPPTENVVHDGESPCFFHDHRRAETACESCGRFICSLCEIDLRGHIICPDCLNAGQIGTDSILIEKRRVLRDSMALFVATVPLCVPLYGWVASLFTSPFSVYLAAKSWKQPRGFRRTRIRSVLAMVIGLAGTCAWITLAIYWIARWAKL